MRAAATVVTPLLTWRLVVARPRSLAPPQLKGYQIPALIKVWENLSASSTAASAASVAKSGAQGSAAGASSSSSQRLPAGAAMAAAAAAAGAEQTAAVKQCGHCGVLAGSLRNGAAVALKSCTGCRCVRYCGAACQNAAWGEHKAFCKQKQKDRKAQEAGGAAAAAAAS